jgi:hypothetical protein
MAKNKIIKGLNQAIGYNQGWNEAMEEAGKIALAIDSGRGNEKEISKAIQNRKIPFNQEQSNVK